MNLCIKLPKLNSINIHYLIALLLFTNSGFYFFDFPIIAPVYIFFYIGVLFYIVDTVITMRIAKIPLSSILALCFCIYILISQIFVGGKPIAILGSIATFLFYVLGTLILPRFKTENVLKIGNLMLILSLLIYGIDTIYRLALFKFNLFYLLTGLNFYQMKIATLLYADTNTIGINTVVLTFFAYYLYLITSKRYYWFFILLFSILNFLSFSRASIIAEILTVIFLAVISSLKILFRHSNIKSIYQLSLKKILNFLFLLILAIIGIFVTLKIIIYISIDPSFGTKIELFNTMKNFLHNASNKDLLLGIGYNNGRLFEFGSERGYAHTYLLTYLCETGFCGYILVTIFLLTAFLETPKNILILFPFVIVGISLIAHTQLHLFYTVLALIWYFEHFSKQIKYTTNINKNYKEGVYDI